MSSSTEQEVEIDDPRTLEEVISSLQHQDRWTKDGVQFAAHDDEQQYALVPLDSSIGMFLAHKLAHNEILHRGDQDFESVVGSVVSEQTKNVEGYGIVFVLKWNQYLEEVFDHYLAEAYDPFECTDYTERIEKVNKLEEQLKEQVTPVPKSKLRDLVEMENDQPAANILIPSASDFALLVFSQTFFEDALMFRANFNDCANLKLRECQWASFGMYYANDADFRARVGKCLTDSLMTMNRSVATLVDGKYIASSVVTLFLSNKALFPEDKRSFLVPGPFDLIPKRRHEKFQTEPNDEGVDCFRITGTVLTRFVSFYRKVTGKDQLEEAIEKVHSDYLKASRSTIDFSTLIEQGDPMAHLYRSVKKNINTTE